MWLLGWSAVVKPLPPQRFGAASFQVDRSARRHFGKIFTQSPKRPSLRLSLLPEEINAFCETAKTTPNKRAHLPQMFAQWLNTARNPWASRNRDCYSIPAWVGVRGWGDAGYTADFYLDTLISGLLRDKRCLRYCWGYAFFTGALLQTLVGKWR